MNDKKIVLLMADDNEMVLEGLKALVANDPCIVIAGHCNDGLEVLGKVQELHPDVLVLDISLPGMNGLEVCRSVNASVPETAILMLSMNASERIVIGALENGASGYVIKEAVSREFREAVHTVARGERYISQGIARTVLDKISSKGPAAQEPGLGAIPAD